YIGCTITTPDGKNFKFHDADYPGVIYIPLDGREPAVCWEQPYKKPAPKKLPKNPYEPIPKDLHNPRPMYAYELAHLSIVEGHPPNLRGTGDFSLKVGDFKLAMKDIRRVLSVSMQEVVYIVIETDSLAGDALYKGKVYRQTAYGFISDLNYAYLSEVGRNAKGGQVMMKKEAELLVGAACSAVGAFGGIAAITAMTMNILLMNSEQIFTAARGIEELMKVKDVLAQNTPEFWKLCRTVLRLTIINTPDAMWADPYGSVRLAGELVMMVGEAILLKRVKSLGLFADIIKKLMQGFFGKLTDAATLALAGKDIVSLMKEYDPTLDDERATRIANEIKDHWNVVEPALTVLKSVADQLVGA
ncbi:MAG: hypothetical protein WCB68_12390, partial [Pyrinomonadaceae bacterium]